MGYILKKSTGGGGGGDATAFNQIAQLNQLQSIQVDANNQSAFLDSNSQSTFNDSASGKSVFKTINGNSLFEKSLSSNVNTKVQYFEEATLIALSASLQGFLTTLNLVVISIVYADRGGIGLPHTMILVYNEI